MIHVNRSTIAAPRTLFMLQGMVIGSCFKNMVYATRTRPKVVDKKEVPAL
jgi:hypothetical protein